MIDDIFIIDGSLYVELGGVKCFAPMLFTCGEIKFGPPLEFTYEKKILLSRRIEVFMCYVHD